MKVYEYLGYNEGDFPETESTADRIFSIPMYPELTADEQEQVIKALKEYQSDESDNI